MSSQSNRRAPFVTSALLLAVLSTIAPAKTIYVDDDATGANNGTSWTDAYTFLQEALADARLAEKPVEIRVAQGTYKPDQGLVAIPEFDWREATFQLINGVTLKGGFAGSKGSYPNTRDIQAYLTILSGDLNGDDVEIADPEDLTDEPSRAENSYHVVTGSGTDDTAVLDGLLITGGNAHLSGIWLEDERSPETNEKGGGAYNWQGNPTITDCSFNRNSARVGGGMHNSDSNLMLTNCIFSENHAQEGGAIHNSGGSPTLIDCTINENAANFGGGILNRSGSSPTLTNCNFTGNSAEWGGGICDYGSDSTLTRCKFTGNSAGIGAGMSCFYGDSIVSHCIFSQNSAELKGGGVCCDDNRLTLANCTFSGNLSGTAGGMGTAEAGGIAHYHGSTTVLNCILWNDGNEIWNDDGSPITVTYSNIQGGFPGEGNIDADPLFADPGYWAHVSDPNIVVDPNDPNAVWVDGDYHLTSQLGRWDPVSGSWGKDNVTSSCIDAGDPDSDWGDEVWPHGGRVNMGAYGGTREASMSAEPQAMSLPRVLYIYDNDVEAAESFRSLLTGYGCATTLLELGEVATAALDSCDIIIAGNDTGSISRWGDAESVAAIEGSGQPVVGLGEGGYALFGQLGLSIGWPNGGHGSRDSISVIDPSSSLFSVPYQIDVPEDGALQLYTATLHVGLYLWPMPETVTALGGEGGNPGYYPLALEHDRYLFWGFVESVENMTEAGKHLFVNAVIRTANAAWMSEGN